MTVRRGGGRAVLQRAAAEIGTVIDPVRSAVDALATALHQLVDAVGQTRSVTARDLLELRPVITAVLRDHPRLVDGTGVVMAPQLLSDRPYHLEWWRSPGPRRLELDLDPESAGFYDYSQMDWFRGAQETADGAAHGPWVDHNGADTYVITFSRPVHDAGGRFVGIAGADVPLTAVEAAAAPALRQGPGGLVLLNEHRRVVASGTPDTAPGVLLRGRPRRPVAPVEAFGPGWGVTEG